MSLNRYAQRRDDNEETIVSALIAGGFEVMRLQKPFDLLVWRINGVAFVLIEVKTGTGQPTAAQASFMERSVGLPRVIARNADEALAAARQWC